MKSSLIAAAAVVLTASLTGGCASYDYLQRSDHISYHAGEAVRANLERETITPWSRSMYDTSGLGRNGSVIPPENSQGSSTTTAPQPPPAEPTAAPPPPA